MILLILLLLIASPALAQRVDEDVEAVPLRLAPVGESQADPVVLPRAVNLFAAVFNAPDQEPRMNLEIIHEFSADGKTWVFLFSQKCKPPPWISALTGKPLPCGGSFERSGRSFPTGAQVRTRYILSRASLVRGTYTLTTR